MSSFYSKTCLKIVSEFKMMPTKRDKTSRDTASHEKTKLLVNCEMLISQSSKVLTSLIISFSPNSSFPVFTTSATLLSIQIKSYTLPSSQLHSAFRTMGRGRGKGRKLNDSVNHEDCASGEEEKIPVQKKRGRPLKHLKEEVRNGVNKMDEGDRENTSFVSASKHKSQCDGLKKRKMKCETKENEEHSDAVKVESADETTKSSSIEEEPVKPSGFRQNSRRRKNTPRRAAEAVVECY